MLERPQGLPEGTDGVKAVGRISRDDYERVFEPLIDGTGLEVLSEREAGIQGDSLHQEHDGEHQPDTRQRPTQADPEARVRRRRALVRR